ncbi:hypothetical protein DAI22_01g118200 [Oryza sativa Japonica Group]|nr:hypothetical protein DAI22_01g118200 [Oryza sativa Japonica Group]
MLIYPFSFADLFSLREEYLPAEEVLRRWPRWRAGALRGTAAPPEPLWRCRRCAPTWLPHESRRAAAPQLPLAGSPQPHGTKRRPVEPASRRLPAAAAPARQSTGGSCEVGGGGRPARRRGESRRPRDGGGCEVSGGGEIGEAEGRQRECDAAEVAPGGASWKEIGGGV